MTGGAQSDGEHEEAAAGEVYRLPRQRKRKTQDPALPFGATSRPGRDDPTAAVELQGIMAFGQRQLGELPLTPEKIRRIRKELGLSQTQFGQLLNVSVVTVHRWESSEAQAVPSPWLVEVLTGIGMLLDNHTVGDSVRCSLVYRGAVHTLHDLLTFVYLKS